VDKKINMQLKRIIFLSFFIGYQLQMQAQVSEKFEALMYGERTTNSSRSRGHSHNDYKQDIPFLKAYHAGMQSIEADVFLYHDTLFVAHERHEIKQGETLESRYVQPLRKFFELHGNQAFADSSKGLQLVIDIKEDYRQTIPAILNVLQPYQQMFDVSRNPHAVRVVLSGDMPPVEEFDQYPPFLFFDGRPGVDYGKHIDRIAMISQDIKRYSSWNGKGTPVADDKQKLKAVIDAAHALGKPFRFWATHDSPNTWLELEKLGVDWINTDDPVGLHDYYRNFERTTYTQPQPIPVYQPAFEVDGSNNEVKNVILLIGDGMGLAQIKAGISANRGALSISQIRNIGISFTEAADVDNTDSAAGGTALATGEKANNRYVGADTLGQALPTIPLLLKPYGIESALLSTGDATDATPASFYAAQPEREWSEKIAYDYLKRPSAILLGGMPGWYRNTNKQVAFEAALKDAGFSVSHSLAAFQQSQNLKQVVLLPDSAVGPVREGRGPLLRASLEKSIALFQSVGKPFFIMAEGAQIDYGGHGNDLAYVVTEMLDFDEAIASALRFADEEKHTLVVITADHETGGLSLLDADRKKGYVRGHFSTNDHTNIAVPVFAYGPGSQDFSGSYENTEIFHKIMKLLLQGKEAPQTK